MINDYPQSFTEHQKSLLILIREGKSNKQIVAELGISRQIVGNELSFLFHKLNVYNRTQAVIKAIRLGIIDLND